ncbi:MAG: DUF4870 domain-containing protein [Candidatus Eremiobacteraeota bacterium]|nr:DUF4870 domain-containing protein [Candidatus Eremiobacteraeota bacterium]
MKPVLAMGSTPSMDCYFHSNVPSVGPCRDCGKPICATCRDEAGSCPSCRLAAKVDAAVASRQPLGGQVPPRPHPQPAPQAVVHGKAEVAVLPDPVESRALVALGYPLWPLALVSLLERKQSPSLRRAAFQALGFNVGMAAFAGLLYLLQSVPIMGVAASILVALMLPLFLGASVYYGIKTWNGDEVRVPVITDWIDRLPLGDPSTNH